ncbi:DNA (cytosine-5-)-methyltransferase [Staphylococcus chromogenes]|nr:DNA (cytosine-5-)-methyltransferase [Staphylococcus chromogenes]WAG31588.1 DNA (cytosine-5-)-methyltransferase [Staphylococcus chromogenes]
MDVENFHQDVRFIDGTQYKGNVDLFVGGSPCQSFSMVGKRGGFEDTRSTLFYEYARLIKEIQPKIFIYENVKGVINHDKGNTWTIMQNVFNQLGYTWQFTVLNAKHYGIPQNRERLFVVGFIVRNNHSLIKTRIKTYFGNFTFQKNTSFLKGL